MMKSVLKLFVLISMLVPSASHAQFLRSYGLKFGAANANQTWDYTGFQVNLQTDSRWGLNIGAYVEALNVPYVSILVEVHYLQKGVILSLPIRPASNPEGEFLTLKPRVDYFSILLMGKVRFETGLITPFFIAGPRLDVLVGRKDEGFQVVLEEFKSVDVGASIGAGFEIPIMGNARITAEFKYSPSFTNSFDNGFLKVKNKSMEFLVGIGF